MNNNFQKLVQLEGDEIFSVPVPVAYPKAICFECIDTRLLKASRDLSKFLGFNEGELYPNKTKGSLNDLLNTNESIKLNCHESIELLVENGAGMVILTAHTDCAADKKLYGIRPYEEDLKHQKMKLQKGFVKISEYSTRKLLDLKIRCFLFDIIDGKVSVKEIIHKLSSDDHHEEKLVVFA